MYSKTGHVKTEGKLGEKSGGFSKLGAIKNSIVNRFRNYNPVAGTSSAVQEYSSDPTPVVSYTPEGSNRPYLGRVETIMIMDKTRRSLL